MPLSAPHFWRTDSFISLPATISVCSEAAQPGMWVRAIPPTPMMPTLRVILVFFSLQVEANFAASLLAAVNPIKNGLHLERMFRRDRRRRAVHNRLCKFDTFQRVRFHSIGGQLQCPIVMLPGLVISRVDFAFGPVAATLCAVQP